MKAVTKCKPVTVRRVEVLFFASMLMSSREIRSVLYTPQLLDMFFVLFLDEIVSRTLV